MYQEYRGTPSLYPRKDMSLKPKYIESVKEAYTAVKGVLDPPEPAPSMLNMWPPLCWSPITHIASRVQIIDPTKFVETIYPNNYNILLSCQLIAKIGAFGKVSPN